MHALHAVPEDMLQPVVANESRASNQKRQLLWAQTVLAVAMYQAAICEVCSLPLATEHYVVPHAGMLFVELGHGYQELLTGVSDASCMQRQRYGVRAWTSECQFTIGDMLASLHALRDLLAAHFTQSSAPNSCEATNSEQLRSSVLATAESLLSDVHYGGRVAVATDRRVLACMLSCTVLPVVGLLLQEDGKGRSAGYGTVGASSHYVPAAAKLALQFNANQCKSIGTMIEAISGMPELDSTLELVGIEPDVALASETRVSCSFFCMHAQTALQKAAVSSEYHLIAW